MTLSNSGTIQSQVEAGGQLDYLEVDLVNDGTVKVESGEFRQDENTTTTNGDVILDAGGQFNLTAVGDVFNQQSDGTLTFEIASPTSLGTLNLSNGATFHLNGGMADPVLASGYGPAVGTEYNAITGTWGGDSNYAASSTSQPLEQRVDVFVTLSVSLTGAGRGTVRASSRNGASSP